MRVNDPPTVTLSSARVRPASWIVRTLLLPAAIRRVARASVFIGWRVAAHIPAGMFGDMGAMPRRLVMFSLRYVCPLLIAVVAGAALLPG
jgi:hypothetical protein